MLCGSIDRRTGSGDEIAEGGSKGREMVIDVDEAARIEEEAE